MRNISVAILFLILSSHIAFSQELVLDRIERHEIELYDKPVYVHSLEHMPGDDYERHKQIILINFPKFENTKYKKQEVISWAYAVASIRIRTDEVINPPFEQTDNQAKQDELIVGHLSTLGAYSLDLTRHLSLPISEKPFRHYVMDAFNAQRFIRDASPKYIYGVEATSGLKRFDDSNDWSEVHYICLDNINKKFNLTLKVSAVAIIETRYYKESSEGIEEKKDIN